MYVTANLDLGHIEQSCGRPSSMHFIKTLRRNAGTMCHNYRLLCALPPMWLRTAAVITKDGRLVTGHVIFFLLQMRRVRRVCAHPRLGFILMPPLYWGTVMTSPMWYNESSAIHRKIHKQRRADVVLLSRWCQCVPSPVRAPLVSLEDEWPRCFARWVQRSSPLKGTRECGPRTIFTRLTIKRVEYLGSASDYADRVALTLSSVNLHGAGTSN